ncbi:hypothetical protein PNEG_02284 [Pneumocystis murina B123]|uniref:Kinetochore protein Sos7 coiled-coil domain-containing protein n=1 Tax=Pneumocystis murina (strain B123) TaxID=1069680 RepID=M7PFV4_PNEMU|nr:hypothetical protein PNEG_02284 [Pneumocystis murina B123]EMR09329.1 hypothetical protein PNEG_02284 [Pneumocystis murina B123]
MATIVVKQMVNLTNAFKESKENNMDLLNIQKAISSFISTKLFIHSQKQDYIRKTNSAITTSSQQSDLDKISNLQIMEINENVPSPNMVESDLKYFKELFSKLKFSYIEQETKERYLRAILDDPILVIENKDNLELEKKNMELKSLLKNTKESLNATCQNLEQTISKVCNEYEIMIQQALEASDMLKEIEKMEAEIEELKDNEQNAEQNLSLKDSLSLLSSQTAKSIKLKKDIKNYQTIYQHKKKQLEEATEEIRKSENEKQSCETFAKEALHTRNTFSTDNRYKKEQTCLWYQSLLDLQTSLFEIKNLKQDNTKEHIYFTLKTHTGDINIHICFKDGRFHDIYTDPPVHTKDILMEAKKRNDPLFLINNILSKA